MYDDDSARFEKTETPAAESQAIPGLRLLPQHLSLLLDLSLWFQYMSGVHAGKYVGNDLQWHHLAMP